MLNVYILYIYMGMTRLPSTAIWNLFLVDRARFYWQKNVSNVCGGSSDYLLGLSTSIQSPTARVSHWNLGQYMTGFWGFLLHMFLGFILLFLISYLRKFSIIFCYNL
jgi:hypothetical protein